MIVGFCWAFSFVLGCERIAMVVVNCLVSLFMGCFPPLPLVSILVPFTFFAKNSLLAVCVSVFLLHTALEMSPKNTAKFMSSQICTTVCVFLPYTELEISSKSAAADLSHPKYAPLSAFSSFILTLK